MVEFFENVLKISKDGSLSINEVIFMTIVVVFILLVLAMFKGPIVKWLNSVTPGRKKTIFSHRKNQYKNSIGKKSRSSKNKK